MDRDVKWNAKDGGLGSTLGRGSGEDILKQRCQMEEAEEA